MIKLSKLTMIKQPKPFSKCVSNLIRYDSYDSELYRKSFKLRNGTKYHYTKCIGLCKQKNLGEKCKVQLSWLGQSYYQEMINDIYKFNITQFECGSLNINPSDDYLAECNCPLECEKTRYTIDHSSVKTEDENYLLS